MTVLDKDDIDDATSKAFSSLQPVIKGEFIDLEGPQHRAPPPAQLITDGEFTHLLGVAITLDEHLIPLRLMVTKKFTEIAALAEAALSGPFTLPGVRASFVKLIHECHVQSLETINREGKRNGG